MKFVKSELYIWTNTFRDPHDDNEELLVIRHINHEQMDDKTNDKTEKFVESIMYLQHNTVYEKPRGMIRNEGDVNKIGDSMSHQWCEKYITNRKKG